MGLGQVLTIGALAFEEIRDGIRAKAVDAEVGALRWPLYLGQIQQAHRAWNDGNLVRMRQLLLSPRRDKISIVKNREPAEQPDAAMGQADTVFPLNCDRSTVNLAVAADDSVPGGNLHVGKEAKMKREQYVCLVCGFKRRRYRQGQNRNRCPPVRSVVRSARRRSEKIRTEDFRAVLPALRRQFSHATPGAD